jgi:hypothetical protein
VPAHTEITWRSTGIGLYCGCLSSSTSRAPRSSCARETGSRSEENEANASRSRNCESASLRPPATVFIALICASPPTLETDWPTLIAGRTPELNRSVSRKICPSVIEITFVGIYAEMSLALVSTMGNPVIEPAPRSLDSLAQRSSSRECR